MKGRLALGAYVLIKGCDPSLLKWLQERGQLSMARFGIAEDPISFCNVFFFASLASGLVLLLIDLPGVRRELPTLTGSDRWLLASRAALGFCIGPLAYFLALRQLPVVSLTLLLTLILPVTALLARSLLGEPLPRRFGLTLVLLPAGLWLSSAMAGSMDSAADRGRILSGVGWALVSVLAFACAGILNRLSASRNWGIGLTLGLTSLGAAAVFGIIALLMYGPDHFFFPRLWWVVGVLLGYAGVIRVGSELCLLASYRQLGALAVALWGNGVVVVAILSAHLLLGEPLGPRTLAGSALILSALALGVD
ncbi:MAG: DMT family transporter [Cyanobacteriota bacterium]|nr:DMT family transporter [Cyanobacteriota bacterium]